VNKTIEELSKSIREASPSIQPYRHVYEYTQQNQVDISKIRESLPLSAILPNPESIVRNYTENELAIECARAMVVSDIHAPYYDKDFAETVVPIAKKMGIDTLIIAGDLIDESAIKPSIFPPNFHQVTLKDELAITRAIMKVWVKYFDNVYFIRGNHDSRIMGKLSNEITMEEVSRLLDDSIKYTDYRHIILKSGKKVWRITHPKSYRQTAGSVARELASKFHQNIMCAHGHLFAHVMDKSGTLHCIDTGGLFEPSGIEYLHYNGDTTHAMWNKAYWMILDGSPVSVLPETIGLFL
jgi:predicted phosphodiesterase